MTIQMIPLKQIKAGETQNARVSNRVEGIEELAASIAAHGLIQSLRVSPAGKKGFTVVAGNRRLAALQLLAERGEIHPDHEVPCIVDKADAAAAFELSTAENVLRLPMTVVDEFRAFARMIDEGKGKEEVAQRFGVPVRRVEQRMRLAGLHEDVIAALEKGDITIEAAQAFTVTNDRERQRQLLETGDHWIISNPRSIRDRLTSDHLSADSRLAKLLTEEAYVAAGGKIIDNLFGDERYWISSEIVEQLTEAHWKKQTEAWLAEGWAFVSPAAEYGSRIYSMRHLYAGRLPDREPSEEDAKRLEEIATRLAELETIGEADGLSDAEDDEYYTLDSEQQEIGEKYAGELAYSAEQKAGSGVVYEEDGSHVRFGVVDAAKATPPGSDEKPAGAAKEAAEDESADLTATMKTALTVTMTHALQQKVAGDPDMALRILAATLHTRMRVSMQRPPVHISGSYGTYDHQKKPEQGASFAEALTWASEQSQDALLAYLATLVGECIDVRDTNEDRPSQASIDALISYVNPNVLPIFDPGAYFAGIKKPLILAAYTEMTGGKTLSAGAKKGELVEVATAEAKVTGWLPEQLRTAAYAGSAGNQGEIENEAA